MDSTTEIIVAALTGGLSIKLIDVAVAGWKQQAAVRGKRTTRYQALLAVTWQWVEHALHSRNIALKNGATPNDLGETPEYPSVITVNNIKED